MQCAFVSHRADILGSSVWCILHFSLASACEQRRGVLLHIAFPEVIALQTKVTLLPCFTHRLLTFNLKWLAMFLLFDFCLFLGVDLYRFRESQEMQCRTDHLVSHWVSELHHNLFLHQCVTYQGCTRMLLAPRHPCPLSTHDISPYFWGDWGYAEWLVSSS